MGSNSAALLPTLVIAVITFFGKPVENNVPKTFLVDLENNFTWHKKLQLDLTPELADNSGICSGEVLT